MMEKRARETLSDQDKGPEMARRMSDKYREDVSRVENLNRQGGRSRQFDTAKWLKHKGITPTWDYDYDKALRSGVEPTSEGKWPSKYKHDLSPERYRSTSEGWLDTKTSARTGQNVFADWTEVLTQEMKRGDYLERRGMWSDAMKKIGPKMGQLLRESNK